MNAVLEEDEVAKLSPEAIARAERIHGFVREDIELAIKLANEPESERIATEARLMAGTPAGFAQLVLGVGIYQWQNDVLNWFEDTMERCKGSLCTPNGAGKSSVIVASLALWWISVHPQGKVVITTKDSKQLDNQIWPAIERHKDKFPGFDFIERMVRNGKGGFIVGFTTDDPGRAEGWHKINDTTGPLLIIIDEAKSVSDDINMALDRCTYNAKFVTSSPGLTEGFFYRTQSDVQEPPPLGWHHMKVGLADCPHIPQERIDDILNEYGPDHWFTRSTLYGEFTDADSDTLFVIPKHIVRHIMDNPPKYVPGGQRAFCDFAAGRDENVFALKRGNRIEVTAWKDPDTMRAVGDFIKLFIDNGLTPAEIFADAGGMGIPILHRFNQLGWPINAVNNESAPLDDVRYPNVGAENWHNAALKLGQRDIILPNDPILFDQLTMRRAAPTTKAILGLETKRDMKKRGVKSPDRADAVVGVLAADSELANVLFDETGLANLESKARGEKQPDLFHLEMGEDGKISYEKRSDGWLRVYEKPVIGFDYITVLNPHRHDEPLKNHTLLVIRAPYTDEVTKREVPTKLVAKVGLSPFRLDARPLAELIVKVTGWYGRAMVVPIVNDRGDIIEHLTEQGVHIYSREELELQRKGRKATWEYGWESNDFTRSLWIGALAEKIRNDEIVVEDLNVVMQLYQIQPRCPSAMKEAEALGVGLQLLNHATRYAPPVNRSQRGKPQVSQYS